MIEGDIRREKIIEIMSNQKEPVSGSDLAKKFGVSRQVIVQDIALLRATNKNILTKVISFTIREKVRRSQREAFVCSTRQSRCRMNYTRS